MPLELMPIIRRRFWGKKRREIKERETEKNSDAKCGLNIGLLRSRMQDARDMIKSGQICGALLLKKSRGEWGLVLSCLRLKMREQQKDE